MDKRLVLGFSVFVGLIFVLTSSVYAQAQKQESCQVKLEAVKKRSLHATELAENMFVKFGAISAQVQKFYIDKGLVVDNYSELLADIETKRTTVESTLDAVSTLVKNFNCENNPKTQITEYRKGMQKIITSLKEYRRSVRNLIVAVHSKAK